VGAHNALCYFEYVYIEALEITRIRAPTQACLGSIPGFSISWYVPAFIYIHLQFAAPKLCCSLLQTSAFVYIHLQFAAPKLCYSLLQSSITVKENFVHLSSKNEMQNTVNLSKGNDNLFISF